MITVWGRTTSINVQAVMWAIGELGLEHERLDFGGAFGKTDTPQYGAMNPNRLVPVLRDGDGPYLWESASIVRYLGARYGNDLFWPKDPLRRADLDKWAEWSKTTFASNLLTGLFGPIWRTPEAQRNPAAITAAEARMKAQAAIIDTRLGDGPYLDGETFSFADIAVGVPLYRYFNLPFDRAETPNLTSYYERLASRPAYAAHVMISFESLRVK